MKRYLIYHLRWQMGFVITLPAMYLTLDYLKFPYWVALVIMQFLGALVFYPIDKYIFKSK